MGLFEGIALASVSDVELIDGFVGLALRDADAPELQTVRAELQRRGIGEAAGVMLALRGEGPLPVIAPRTTT